MHMARLIAIADDGLVEGLESQASRSYASSSTRHPAPSRALVFAREASR
jgi:hypothetical protein